MTVLVAQLCLTLCDPMAYSPPGSSVLGNLQARILEWVAIPSRWFRRKEFTCSAGDPGLILGLERSPGESEVSRAKQFFPFFLKRWLK